MLFLQKSLQTFARNSRRFSSKANDLAFAFDIDGVLLRSSTPIPKAGEALKLLDKNRVPYILLTNGGGYLEKEKAQQLSEILDVDINERQVVLSHTPYKTLTTKFDKVLTIGIPNVRNVAEAYGFKHVVHQSDVVRYNKYITPFTGLSHEELMKISKDIPDIDSKKFDAVLVFNDPHDWAADLQIITDMLVSQNGFLNTIRSEKSNTPSIPIYFSNNDLLWANKYTLNRFGQGAFRSLVNTLYSSLNDGKQLHDYVIGKPTSITYNFAHNILIQRRNHVLSTTKDSAEEFKFPRWGEAPERSPFRTLSNGKRGVFMVGDNPASDIIGANKYGWTSCLVTTGVYKENDRLEGAFNPDIVEEDVYNTVQTVLNKYL